MTTQPVWGTPVLSYLVQVWFSTVSIQLGPPTLGHCLPGKFLMQPVMETPVLLSKCYIYCVGTSNHLHSVGSSNLGLCPYGPLPPALGTLVPYWLLLKVCWIFQPSLFRCISQLRDSAHRDLYHQSWELLPHNQQLLKIC